VSPAVHEQAADRQLRTIDATCPLVTKVHQEVKRYARDDYDILLIGHAGHEEVDGTTGEAPSHVQLVDRPEDVDKVEIRDPSKVIWLSPDDPVGRRDHGARRSAARPVSRAAEPAQRRHLLRPPRIARSR